MPQTKSILLPMNQPVSCKALVARLTIPAIVYGALAWIWLTTSSEVATEGRILGLVCLVLGFLLPTYLVIANRRHEVLGYVTSAVAILTSMLLYDAKIYLVAKKMDPFQILGNAPGSYILGFVALAILVYLTGVVARFTGDKVVSNEREA